MSIRKVLNQHRRWITPLLLAVPAALRAQPAATVPASSGIYERLESISAYYPARGVFLGERSLSRREIDRIVALLNRRLTADSADSPRRRWARRELDAVTDALASRRGRLTGRYGEA